MSDRFPACIRIGGQLSRTQRILPDDPGEDTTILQGLISALNDDGASHEYGDSRISADCSEEELLCGGYINADGVLIFRNSDARGGEFEETEAFCIEHGIPFDRWSDHYCEYDAENAYFRPNETTVADTAIPSPVTTYADSDGHEIVSGATVREAMAKLDAFAADRSQDWQRLQNGLKLLHEVCPELPASLPKFKILP